MSPPSRARAAAARVLQRVLTGAAYADLALDAELTRRPLNPRDSALATELVYGTLRWQRYIDWVLAPHSKRRLDSLDPVPLVLLRLTAYQLVFLTRIPPFAAVNDAVELCRQGRAKPGVAAFVNAVLRAFARRGPREREPSPPPDPVDALATRCSFPTWLAARWVARYGAEEAEALMRAMNARPPLTLRTNVLKLDREALATRLRNEEQLSVRPTAHAPEGLVVEPGGRPTAWRAFADGAFVVQDEASMLVARLLAPGADDTTADACAAPGTKTTHLAQLMDNRGRVLAFDPQAARLALVREATARLGITVVETFDGAVEALAPRFTGVCDAVLVDAPCSNLGVLRRNPDVKWRRQPADIPVAVEHQQSILRSAATVVKPGGRLVYATCSLEPEENDEVVRAFLADHADFRTDPPPDFVLALDPDGVLRCLPHRHGTDGFTAIRLRRTH